MNTPPAAEYAPLLAVALDCAQRASAVARQGWMQREHVEVSEKQPGDVVTSIDHAAEAAALDAIRSAFPDHAILSEEAGSDGLVSDYLWIVDPIDGSVNFAHGLADFAVSVACLLHGRTVVGVIIDPIRGDTYHAVRNGGAWRNGQRVRVSTCADLRYALLGTVFPKPRSATMPAYLPALHAALNTAQGVRRSGSMVLDLARVACGQLDGFWQVGMKAWDLAAGGLLIEEAGGRVDLRTQGRAASTLDATACVAAAPGLIDALSALLGDFDSVAR